MVYTKKQNFLSINNANYGLNHAKTELYYMVYTMFPICYNYSAPDNAGRGGCPGAVAPVARRPVYLDNRTL